MDEKIIWISHPLLIDFLMKHSLCMPDDVWTLSCVCGGGSLWKINIQFSSQQQTYPLLNSMTQWSYVWSLVIMKKTFFFKNVSMCLTVWVPDKKNRDTFYTFLFRVVHYMYLTNAFSRLCIKLECFYIIEVEGKNCSSIKNLYSDMYRHFGGRVLKYAIDADDY